jgi:hypothetical protein
MIKFRAIKILKPEKLPGITSSYPQGKDLAKNSCRTKLGLSTL